MILRQLTPVPLRLPLSSGSLRSPCRNARITCYNPSMREVWLRNNRRALIVGMILPGLWLLAGVAAFATAWATGQAWWLAVLAAMISLPPLWLLASLVLALTRPRLAYEDGELLVYVEAFEPARVPIEIVEVFFLGQGPTELPKLAGREHETHNVVVRLAESAAEWKHRDARPAFGQWCEGYITLRGSWCEPITRELMQRLNRRLAEVQRERGGRSTQVQSKETVP